MQSIANDIRAAIARRLDSTTPAQVLAIACSLLELDAAKEKTLVATSVSAAPPPRFQIIDEHQVLDRSTGLVWSRANVPGGRMKWQEAKDACAKLGLGGHSSWRLPTIKELQSLVDFDRHEPAIDTNFFQCDSSWYSSSTPLHASPGVYAWLVNFNDGGAGYGGHGSGGFVRAVRVGQF